jgi:hypothetical protein
MPTSVKISQLPIRAQVFNNDRVPVVDSAETQTSTVTAAQIAALGGGPPADLSVTTAKLADRSVTYPKIQNVSADTLLGRASPLPGVVEEITCTPFMRSVLASPDSLSAANAIGALASTVDPIFTGAVKLPDGTAGAPSLTNTGDLDTGLFFPADNTIGLSTDGYERFRIGEDGTLYANFPGTSLSTELKSAFFVRAWMSFNGSGSGTFTIANQHTICQRYRGVWGSLANTPNTRAKIIYEEGLRGNTLTEANISSVGTENRLNYTTCGDNTHFYWSTNDPQSGQWLTMNACSSQWIGRITATPNTPVTIQDSGGFATLARGSVGFYTLTFLTPMPDANYAAIATTGWAQQICACLNKTAAGFAVQVRNRSDGALSDSSLINVVVVR